MYFTDRGIEELQTRRGDEEVTFDWLAEQLRKGNKVYAEGQLRQREYETRDGEKRTSLELAFARVVNLERRPRDEDGSGGGGGGSYSDAPSGIRPRLYKMRSAFS